MAEEAEEIGVEHLLRDIRDVAVGTLSTRITNQLQSLQGLHLRLRDIGVYLGKVVAGELPVNHSILGNLQDVFNLLPGLSAPPSNAKARMNGTSHLTNGVNGSGPSVDEAAANGNELARAMSVKTNDQLMAIYLSSLIRAITAFHDLIENKIQNRQQAEERAGKKEEDSTSTAEDKTAAANGEEKTAEDASGKTKEDKPAKK